MPKNHDETTMLIEKRENHVKEIDRPTVMDVVGPEIERAVPMILQANRSQLKRSKKENSVAKKDHHHQSLRGEDQGRHHH